MAMTVTLAASLFVLAVYLNGPLQGDFRKFFLPAKMFGVPEKLRLHGISELFTDNTNSGWDGQFYYYISNDLLASGDTDDHIDSNAYRYQRIGLPLLASVAAKLTGQSWVSPESYYLTSLALILIATGMGAYFFQQRGISLLWILPWSLCFGTQVTQLNGLPDGAADALLIISLVSLYQGLSWIYVTSMTLAVLSREVYVLIPAFIVFFVALVSYRNFRGGISRKCIFMVNRLSVHAVAPLVWMVWQIFIRHKFGVSPGSQATRVLDWPLHTVFHYLFLGLSGRHPVAGTGHSAHLEGAGILFYLALLILSLLTLIPLLKRNTFFSGDKNQSVVTLGITAGFAVVIFLYLCFGPTVMMYRTGYLKALSIFIFVLPFYASLLGRGPGKYIGVVLVLFSAYSAFILWHQISAPAFASNADVRWVEKEPACLKNFQARFLPESFEGEVSHNIIQRMIFHPAFTVNVAILNTSGENFSPYRGKGTVNLSYQWLNQKSKKIVLDGNRTVLPHTLRSGKAITLPLKVKIPVMPGKYILRISAVQEGCSWFYLANASSAYDILYTIR